MGDPSVHNMRNYIIHGVSNVCNAHDSHNSSWLTASRCIERLWRIYNYDVRSCFLSDILCCAEQTFDIACSRQRARAAFFQKRENAKLLSTFSLWEYGRWVPSSVQIRISLAQAHQRFGSSESAPAQHCHLQFREGRLFNFDASCSCRRINRKKIVFQNMSSFLDDEDIPSQQDQGARLDIQHARLFLTWWGRC